ncbi:hypothetical protein ALI22I_40145 [Saccharothrix sp. ALI-22-I]|uniref:hypothetical protein n=1 Tax=Saccharothrix sp. ALI-22-I TaxID=1933778 RepID=UPI00097C6189|nr:hypothetical protein [Saccharothrix sp. ALI-22-I]ONI82327.1 hypothetical protein ALI22I_40145 [Saccharothrix sp. ALI-22-I]
MDEQKLAELFRDAARDAPPPSFDVAGVRSASARVTARRRSAIALGSTLALVLVFGGVAVTSGLLENSTSDTAVAGSAEDGSSLNVTPFSAGQPELIPKDASPDRSGGIPPKSIPDDPSTQGDEPSGSADRPSVGSAQRGCVEVDRELAVALADELSVANTFQAAPAAADCPIGSRGASYPVRDGAIFGTVSAVIAPPGTLVPESNVQYQTAKTPAGDELYLLSRPEEGSSVAPFSGELASMAQRLAARL